MNTRTLRLSNGLRVALLYMDGAKTFTEICVMGGGSRYETANVSGISHMLEHMMFKGTKNRPSAKDISIELETLGGVNNAFTSEETVGYWVNAPAGRPFFQVTDILSDQLSNSLLAQEEIEREKNAVMEEINMRASDPMTSAFDMLTPLIYGDQAAGRDVAGTKETVRSLTRRQLKRYMDKYTVAENMVLVVAGSIPAGVEAVLEKHYSGIPSGALPRKYKLKPPRQVEAEAVIKNIDIPQTSFALAVRSPSMASEDKHALKVLGALLGRGMSSRLFLEVRERRGLAYSVSAANDIKSDTGNMIIYAGVSPENLYQALEVIKGVFQNIASEPPGEEEMNKVKSMLHAGTIRAMDSVNSMAINAAEDLLLLDRFKSPKDEFQKISKVSPEDVTSLAQSMFVNKNLNLAVVGPHSSSDIEELREVVSF